MSSAPIRRTRRAPKVFFACAIVDRYESTVVGLRSSDASQRSAQSANAACCSVGDPTVEDVETIRCAASSARSRSRPTASRWALAPLLTTAKYRGPSGHVQPASAWSKDVQVPPSAQRRECFAWTLGRVSCLVRQSYWHHRCHCNDLDVAIELMLVRRLPYGRFVRLELVGLAEVADVLEVSKRTAARYTSRPDFPEPVARLRSGPVWLEAEVRAWARNSPAARPGKPLKGARQATRDT
jgi:predicted DNA-binding transcriptional regulator AlpA